MEHVISYTSFTNGLSSSSLSTPSVVHASYSRGPELPLSFSLSKHIVHEIIYYFSLPTLSIVLSTPSIVHEPYPEGTMLLLFFYSFCSTWNAFICVSKRSWHFFAQFSAKVFRLLLSSHIFTLSSSDSLFIEKVASLLQSQGSRILMS